MSRDKRRNMPPRARRLDRHHQALRKQTTELAVLAAGHLLEENLDSDKNRKIVDDFIARIPDAQQN